MKKINSLLLILLFSSTTLMAQVNLKSGLVACYPFNSNANDESSNGNGGTVNGATLTTDRFGKVNSAYNFDGNSYISLAPDQFKNQSYSYATWVKLDVIPAEGDQNCFIVVGGVGADQGLVVASNYSTASANGFDTFGYNSGNPTVSGNWSATKPDVGKWYHVTVTRDNTSIKLYVDGILIANNSPYTATNGTNPAYASPTYAVIGSRVGENGFIQSLRGSLDDIYIYNRAITPEEVTALYQTTKSPAIVDLKKGLMACYPFNANANDESSNGNNGTVNGATLTTDRFGKANSAYNFNGSSLISVSPNQLKNLTFTYATWVKLDNLPAEGDNNCLITVGGNGGDQVLSVTTSYQAQSSNGFNVGGYNNGNPIQSNNWNNVAPTIGKWYHVACTRDNNSIKLYVDGKLIANNSTLTSTGGTTPNYGSPTYVTFGARNGGASQYMQGSLDDIHLYNRAINADEVKALYDGNTPQTITITSDNAAPCGGENITFTATGASATTKYQWKVNDVNTGIQTTSNTFSYNSPTKSTNYQVKISVEITDDEICFPNKIVLKEDYFNIKNCTPCINSLLACHPFYVIKTK